MSLFRGKTVVMDFRPSNNQIVEQNVLGSGDPDILETAMRTYVYDAGSPFTPPPSTPTPASCPPTSRSS
ncbi:MAG: hypothetical protein AAF086_01035 [Planctomycetota bacterium]